MIQEAYRVLQPGGIALFTSPGKLGPGNFMSLISKARTLAGEEKYSSYYLSAGDDESLRKNLKDSGFSKALTFYSSACFPVTSANEVVRFIGKNYAIEYLKKVDPEMHRKALEILHTEIAEVLDSGHAITFDYLVAVAFRDS
ncbi:hypothetical protein SteCoe_3668 [Stentor coeruleus]|uniref:Methyltransferase type 11 domain-containing protein n=1 Tax=Stentor coeruleus TaxID=5963 RepID=A0A1R2CWN2_9CILI|nr:hypothetical protein SteCoe_3668 [Stentor coeruleus]